MVTEAANRRWLKSRCDLVVACLVTVITQLPELFAGCEASVTALWACLGTARLLFELRGHAIRLGGLTRLVRLRCPPEGLVVRFRPSEQRVFVPGLPGERLEDVEGSPHQWLGLFEAASVF